MPSAQGQTPESCAGASAWAYLSPVSFAFVVNVQYGQAAHSNRLKKGFDKFMDAIAAGSYYVIVTGYLAFLEGNLTSEHWHSSPGLGHCWCPVALKGHPHMLSGTLSYFSEILKKDDM